MGESILLPFNKNRTNDGGMRQSKKRCMIEGEEQHVGRERQQETNIFEQMASVQIWIFNEDDAPHY